MQSIVNFFRGSLRYQVTGLFPERFLNLCAQEALPFWQLEWQDSHSLSLTVPRRWRKKVCQLAEQVNCQATASQPAGVPFALSKVKRRYGFLLGMTLSVLTVCILSQFILTIEVTGNETVPTAVILAELSRHGVQVGSFGPDIEERVASQESLLNLPELSWMAVNLHGTRAEVIVREKVAKPDIVDRSTPTHVVADATGIITSIQQMEGQAMFEVGDTVIEGEILLSGVIDVEEPLYAETDLGYRIVHAEGNVYARTWRILSAEIPLTTEVKTYTGEQYSSWAVTFFNDYREFYKNSGISTEKYDKIKTSYSLPLPGGGTFPLGLQSETYQAYTTETVTLNQEAAQQLLETQLLDRLEGLLDQGEILHTTIEYAVKDGLLTATLTAECQEQIGRTVEFEGVVGYYPATVNRE